MTMPAPRPLLTRLFLRSWIRAPMLTATSILGVAAGTGMFLAMSSANLRVLHSLDEASAPARTLISPGDALAPRQVWRSPTGRIDRVALDACLVFASQGIECRGVLTFTTDRVWKKAGPPVRVIAVDGGVAAIAAPVVTRDLMARAYELNFAPVSVFDGSPEPFVLIDHADAEKYFPRGSRDAGGNRGDIVTGFDFIEASAPDRNPGEANEIFALIEENFRGQKFQSGPGPVRARPDEEVENRRNMTASYRLNLSVLGLMSILVASLLLRNTAALQMLLRRPPVAVLRQLGATRSQVLGLVLLEQTLIAIIGSAVGVAGGILLEEAVSAQVLATVRNLYTQTTPSARRDLLGPATLAAAAGCFIYLLSSLAMLRDLLLVQPKDLSAREFEGRERPRKKNAVPAGIWMRLVAALASIAILVAAPWIPPLDLRSVGLASASGRLVPVFGYFAALAIFILAFASSRALAWTISRLLTSLTRGGIATTFPALAISSRRNLRARRKPEAAVATLATGLALVTGITVMVDGFRTSLMRWLDHSFTAEVVALPRHSIGQESRPRLPGAMHDQLKSTMGVQTDCVLLDDGQITGSAGGASIKVAGIDDALPADHADPIEILPELFPKNPSTPLSDLADSRELIRSVIAGNDKFLASEALARRLRLSPGDEVTIAVNAAGESRPMSGTVAAIVRDYSSELGLLFMGKSAYEAATGLDGCHSLRIYTRGIPANEFATKLNSQLPGVAATLDISSSQSLKANALAVFEQTFKVTGILTLLAATLGGIALVVQIAQATASRRLEWLALRRLGTSWQGMARLVAADVFLSIAAGVILGTACGWILGWLLVSIVNRQAFGWTILMGGPQSVDKTIAFSAFYGAILWGSGVMIGWWTMRPGAKWNVRRE